MGATPVPTKEPALMFVSAAVRLTPALKEKLKSMEKAGAFGQPSSFNFEKLFGDFGAPNAPTSEERARSSDLSVKSVHDLESLIRRADDQTAKPHYSSVFLSYGNPDRRFARKLYDALSSAGVKVFFFPESATPGQRLHRTMSNSIHEYDRILLICSRSSVVRPGVLNELEQVLSREAREGGTELLMPVILDDYIFGEWAPARPDVGRQLRERVAADFRATKTKAAFLKQFNRVLKALECGHDEAA